MPDSTQGRFTGISRLGRRATNSLALLVNGTCRLSHQGLRDIRTWRDLTSTEKEARPLRPASSEMMIHSDAAYLRDGGTLGPCGESGQHGVRESQGGKSALRAY
jgi:hypothetical protein